MLLPVDLSDLRPRQNKPLSYDSVVLSAAIRSTIPPVLRFALLVSVLGVLTE